MFRKLLLSVVAFLFIAGTAFAQDTGTLTGTVTDASSGEVLPGVNVFIPELQRGAATDPEGKFTIKNLEFGTYTIRATYIGYKAFKQQVTVDQENVTLDVNLTVGTQTLDDVVVTAYGIERQSEDLTYSAENVDVGDVTKGGSDNFMSSLSGRVSGMKVQSKGGMGGSTDIILRGANSLTGNNQVLFVVDGVPYANERFNTSSMQEGFAGYDYGNTGADINPENIKSMTVLKGPSAAALYGSRASNGAIVIETKQGGGPGDQNVQVTFNSSFGISKINKNTFPDYQTEYGAGYASSFYTEENVFTDAPGDSITVARLNGDGSLGPAFDGQMVYQWDAFTPGHPNYGQPREWSAPENGASEFFETGTNAKNSLMINGNIAEEGYYNVGYTQGNTRGIMPNSSLDEYKLTFKGGYNVTEDLNVSASINYSKTEATGRPKRGYSTVISSMRQWWQTNLDVNMLKDAYFQNKTNATWNLSDARTGPLYWNNPYWDRYQNYQSDSRDRYVGFAKAQYQVADWLSLTGRVSLDNYSQLIEERLNVTSVEIPGYTRRNINYSEYNYDLLANFDRSFTENFSMDGVLGMNIRRQYSNGIEATTNGGLVVPGLFALNNSVNAISYPDETERRLGVNGFFANLNFNYDDYLAVNLTGRRDEASSLPDGNNVYYYPSASVGFTFSELMNTDVLSFGKLRASWAEVGNTAPPYSLQNTYDRNTNFNSSGMYTLPSTRNNPDLEPERTRSWEVGMQLGFVNDRIFLDATYYKRNSTDLIQPANISTATGFSSTYINAGNLENKGLELTLTARPVVTSDFSWSVNANWSKNVSKMKEIAEGINFFSLASPQGGVNIGAELNGPYGVIRGSDFVYHENGQPIVNEDGHYEQTDNSNEVIGNMNPDWRGGISNKLNYKNWSLNFLVDVRWGGDIFSLDQWYGQGTGLYPVTAGLNDKGNPKRDPVSEGGGVRLPGVNADGSENDVYASNPYGYGVSPNAAYVYDGSFVKLREVGLTYDLPQNLLSKAKVLRGASVSVTGRNLWIIHKNLPHADPEQSIGSGSLTGYQGGNLPSTRNVTLNLQLQF